MPKYVSVILPLQLEQSFTYQIPEELKASIVPGIRVVVQFAKRRIYSALVINTHNEKPPEVEIKTIISVLDEKPVVIAKQLELWGWISEYYLCTIGEVFKAAMPAGLKLESETYVLNNPDFDNYERLTEKEIIIHNVLEKRNVLSVNEVNLLTEVKNSLPILNSLLQKGAIKLEEKLSDSYKPKQEAFIRLNSGYNTEEKLKKVFDSLERAPKQLDVLMKYLQLTNFNIENPTAINRKELLGINRNYGILNTLTDKNIFELTYENVDRIKNLSPELIKPKVLIDNQKSALEQIKDQFRNNDVALLHGITSSGKTEIYIHLIKETINQGKQVLYLLPEIALTTQIINRLRAVFGNNVGVYHSKFSDSERVEIWNNLLDDKSGKSYKIILGVRSSVFLPFKNIGIIIIDEEHENTYKQQDPAPRYNARDTAIYLARLHKAKVLLGTATPSFDVYFNCKNRKYSLVELKQRFLNIELPEIIVSNTKEAYKRKQLKSHFTNTLLDHIEHALKNNEQIILFQNRRGFSPYIECTTCGWIPKCNQCDVSLTYHKHFNNLTCHYCGYTVNMVAVCPQCSSTEVFTRGFGTEKIEDEISIFFPDAKVTRMDLDSTRKKHSYYKIMSDFENHSIDILIGTQMVTKGLDFDNVSLVGILNADNMINFPDFRAFERSYQLMTQVSGRAGRKKGRGKVIIQASNPEHPVIKFVMSNDYQKFYNWQIKERERFHYPPFTRLIRITMKHKDRFELNRNSKLLAEELKKVFGKRVLGPEFPTISRIQNWYLKNILLKIEKDKSPVKAKQILKSIVSTLKTDLRFRRTTVLYDVDPL